MEHTITRLAREAARLTNIPYKAVGGPRKKRAYVRARWAVMFVAYDLKYSSVDIGQRIGGFDHSTVLHGIKRGKELLDSGDNEFAWLVRGLARMLRDEASALNGN